MLLLEIEKNVLIISRSHSFNHKWSHKVFFFLQLRSMVHESLIFYQENETERALFSRRMKLCSNYVFSHFFFCSHAEDVSELIWKNVRNAQTRKECEDGMLLCSFTRRGKFPWWNSYSAVVFAAQRKNARQKLCNFIWYFAENLSNREQRVRERVRARVYREGVRLRDK